MVYWYACVVQLLRWNVVPRVDVVPVIGGGEEEFGGDGLQLL